jgi:hypothetical protein
MVDQDPAQSALVDDIRARPNVRTQAIEDG